ncbi:MAG: trypsin-like peptidase domain-containing protein [Elainella sp. Prado103]|jgi:S1-C subfamily serine protease|nr:trypsin-like peptidase domain-containing protein [Elainella sp. Prado103]
MKSKLRSRPFKLKSVFHHLGQPTAGKPALTIWVIAVGLLLAGLRSSGWILQQWGARFLTDPQFEAAHQTLLQMSEHTSGYASLWSGLNQYGISQLDYDTWRQLQGKPVEDLINIQPSEVKAIHQELWHHSQCAQYAPPLDITCLDTALSFGVAQSQALLANLPADPTQSALEVASRRELWRRRAVRPPLTPSKQLTLREGLRRDRALADWIADYADQPEPNSASEAEIPLETDALYQQVKQVTVEIWNNSQFGIATTASGIILTEDGLVLTNYHVIQSNPNPTVQLADGRQFDGTIASIDQELDLALVQLEAAYNLPTATLAQNTALVQLGDTVHAIGSPHGRSWTMSTATVIELESTCANGTSPLRCIRTPSRFLYPGNSGGPLINEFGEVIGINRAVQQSTGEGVSIPIETVQQFLNQRMGSPAPTNTVRSPNKRWF